jgi:hypothetical protein
VVSATLGGRANFAIEASVRDNMPLRSQNMLYPGAFAPAPQYATGRTAHINLSAGDSGSQLRARNPTFWVKSWNRVLKTNDPGHWLDEGTRDATTIQMIYSPSYRQILPGWTKACPSSATPCRTRPSRLGCPRQRQRRAIGLEAATWACGGLLTYTATGQAVPFVDFSTLLTGDHEIYNPAAPADRSHIALRCAAPRAIWRQA